MATLADLKARIVADMGRDDMEPGGDMEATLLSHINRAIRHYSGQNWWFLTKTVTTPTVSGQDYVTRPATVGQIRRISIPALGYDLEREDLTCIEAYDEPAMQTGQPYAWAEGDDGTEIRLWPTPNAIFTLKIVGTRIFSELASDSDTNVWTNEASDVVAAHTRMTLYRDVLFDPREANASRALELALDTMRERNIDRIDMPIKAGW